MSSPAIVLSQDLSANLAGINLKWTISGLAAIKESSVVYFKNTQVITVLSQEIASGLLKCNINSGFDSGLPYSFQLQVTDINGVQQSSNTLQLTSPYTMQPPVITGVVGKDQAVQVTLASTTNVISSADLVEFELIRSDYVIIPIYKAYSSSRVYYLTSDDSALLVNGMSYSVACDFSPASSNSVRYSAPSVMSNTVSVTPSNTPNGTQPTVTSVGTSTLDLRMALSRPSDFADWSSSFSILLSLYNNSSGVTLEFQVPGDVTEYTVVNAARGGAYLATLRYDNDAGEGIPVQSINYVTPTSVPDAPQYLSAVAGDASAVLSWVPPVFNGQSALTGYKV